MRPCLCVTAAALLWLATAATAATATSAHASTPALSVTDDSGHRITLARPARRIVSLAPHATELLFAAGAGAYVVGVVEYSDYPAPARQLPQVGGAATFDVERIAALKPDLVVAWHSGNAPTKLAQLRKLGIPVFESEPRNFAAIVSSVERLAHLAGSDDIGVPAARALDARWRTLAQRYSQRAPVAVFYQIWRTPLMTLNGAHVVSQALNICGGANIFADLPQLAPAIAVEAVLQANPEVIIATAEESASLDDWRRWPKLTAVARNNLFVLPSDLMMRFGPRMVDGAALLCERLEEARGKR